MIAPAAAAHHPLSSLNAYGRRLTPCKTVEVTKVNDRAAKTMRWEVRDLLTRTTYVRDSLQAARNVVDQVMAARPPLADLGPWSPVFGPAPAPNHKAPFIGWTCGSAELGAVIWLVYDRPRDEAWPGLTITTYRTPDDPAPQGYCWQIEHGASWTAPKLYALTWATHYLHQMGKL